MARRLILALMAALLTTATAQADPASRWFHIRVEEKGPDGETVRVNLPVDLVAAVLPAVENKAFHHGSLRLDNHDMSAAELRQILAAVRKAEDGEYISVDGPDEKVRVKKEGGLLLIDVDEGGETPEKVMVKIRMEVVDAMLSGESDQLNIVAAISKLGEQDEGDLVTVYSDDETVHIWVDGKNSIE